MPKIVRMTLFKLTDTEVIQEAIQKYSTLSQDAVKVRSCIAACCTSEVSSHLSTSEVQPRARLMIPVHGTVILERGGYDDEATERRLRAFAA